MVQSGVIKKQAGSKFPEADGLSGLWVPLRGSSHSRQPSPRGTYLQTFLWGHKAEKHFF